jgi:hypothetical protein
MDQAFIKVVYNDNLGGQEKAKMLGSGSRNIVILLPFKIAIFIERKKLISFPVHPLSLTIK